MKCSRCGHDNREGRKFCSECAAPLSVLCPACQAPNEPGEKFCGQCGKPLAAEGAALVARQPPTVTPVPAAPASFASGRYLVRRFLGEGGKKKVYLAQDTLLDREVAFALIKTEGLDETSRLRLRREAQAMGRLGSHPHIVTVFDLGEEGGQPFMVTEFMGGGDVEHLIEKAPEHRLPLERALEIAGQVCQGLGYAHSKGIVHRDLKPGNVWLTAEGVVKIGDFGLALPLNRSRLTSEGMMVGTVAYMPPEQAMGGEVTSKADLYSLGCLLYESLTGRPPFLGDDPVAVIGQHIHTPPVAPSWHNPRCPRDLEALILRLLAKDPVQRPENATEVLAALQGVDLTAVAERSEEESRSLDSLAGGVFVGRQREMGELKAALEEALGGRGRLLMLVGEPGIGKTRTALELATYAGLRGAQALWGRCYEAQGMPPFWPWVQAIRSYVREKNPQELRAAMGAGAADIAEIVSDVRERLPGLQPSPPLEDPEAVRFRLFDSIATFLKGAGRAQPLLLILDDLQWADKPTLALLQFVAGELATSRLLVIGTYRDVELGRKHPLAQTLGELTRERAFQRVLLRGLSQEDVARFIELTSGIEPPEVLVKAVYSQTEGNPLFVNEVVRLLVQEGELSPERLKERKSWSVRIPEGVREAIGRRLNRLSERCNQTLTIAAVIGREFTFAQLLKLVEKLSEERLLAVLEQGMAARVIEEQPRAVGSYQFTHALIQETLAEELSLARRVRLHARIAQALEELYGADAPAHAAELAYHYGEAESLLGTEKLVTYSLLAGEKALATYAYEEALAHFQRGLTAKEGQPMDADMAALCYGLGRAEAALLMVEQMVEHLTGAFDYYLSAGDLPRAIAVASATFSEHGVNDLMQPVVERALEIAPPDSVQAGRLLCSRGRGLDLGEDYEGARQCLLQALAIACRIGDRRLELRALTIAAELAQHHLRPGEEYEEVLRQALSLLSSVDSPWDEAVLRLGASSYYFAAKADPDQAAAQGKAGLAAAERLRDRVHLATALGLSQERAEAVGDWASARAFSEQALAAWPGNPWFPARRMRLECELGNLEQAEICLRPLEEQWEVYLRRQESTPMAKPSVLVGLVAYYVAAAARIAGNARWLDIAKDAARHGLSSSQLAPEFIRGARMALAVVAAEEGAVAAAREQLAALEAVNAGFRVADWFCVLGIAAHAAGELDKAIAYFEKHLALCRKAGYRSWLVWTCCGYADLLLECKGPGDHERATALLDEALALARDLGMRPLMERVLSRRKILKA